MVYSERQRERERCLGKVGRMETVRSSICQKTLQTEKGATALAKATALAIELDQEEQKYHE